MNCSAPSPRPGPAWSASRICRRRSSPELNRSSPPSKPNRRTAARKRSRRRDIPTEPARTRLGISGLASRNGRWPAHFLLEIEFFQSIVDEGTANPTLRLAEQRRRAGTDAPLASNGKQNALVRRNQPHYLLAAGAV